MVYTKDIQEKRGIMNLEIKTWGNSAGLRLTKSILSELSVEVGESLNVTFSDGAMILTPAEPFYILDELLEGSSKESLQLNDEDRQWLSFAPVGAEFK